MRRVYVVTGFDLSTPLATSQRITSWIIGLASHGFEVFVIAPRPSGKVDPRLVLPEIEFIYHGRNISVKQNAFIWQFVRAVSLALFLRRNLRKKVGYVQVEGGSLGGVIGFLGFSGYVLDLPDLDFARDVFSNKFIQTIYRGVTEILQQTGAKKAGRILGVSRSMKAYLTNEWGIAPGKITIVPNGYATDVPVTQSEVEGQAVYAGYLGEYIDSGMLIETAKELAYVGGKLIIAGDGPTRAALETTARLQGISNMTFLGIIPWSAASHLVSQSAVALLPLRESLHSRTCCPTKLTQYAAMKKGIVTTRVSDDAILLEEGSAALVVDPESITEFANAVMTLIKNPTLRQSLGNKAHALFVNRSWEKLAETVSAIYDR